MRKQFLFIIIIMFVLCGCTLENQVTGHDNQIKFSFPSEFIDYLPYEEIPEYILEFTGTIYINIDASTSNKKVFSKNDDFYLSEIVSQLFRDYKDFVTYRLLSSGTEEEARMNHLELITEGSLKQVQEKINVVDNTIYNEMAYIRLENGLILSLEYRRFISDVTGENKTYYSWQKTRSLNIILHFPLLIHINNEDEKELLLLPLPDNVIYRLGVGENVPLKNILRDKSFLGEFYKLYPYPDYSEDPRDEIEFDWELNVEKVKAFYINNYNGRYLKDEFVFTYLDKHFVITFNEKDFKIDYYDNF